MRYAVASLLAIAVLAKPAAAGAGENTLTECKDGKDNDGDGWADCGDQDCGIYAMCSQGSSGGAGGGGAKGPYITRKGGFGIWAVFMIVSRALGFGEDTNGDKGQSKSDLDPAGGFALFGEAMVKPTVAIGGEIILAFPDVDDVRARSKLVGEDWSSWSDWDHCSYCDNGVLFSMSFRARWPIPVHPWVRIYPLLSLGLANYTARYHDVTILGTTIEIDDQNYFGMSWNLGFGVEVSTPVPVTVFFETRYLGGFGGNTDPEEDVDHEIMVLNSFTLALIGIRIF